MKYIRLGYYDEKKWEAMRETEHDTSMEECFAYEDVAGKNGHYGKVMIMDGPYAETKQ
jgi:hypothetical protein